jgi:hypothetical protein
MIDENRCLSKREKVNTTNLGREEKSEEMCV